MIIDHFKSALQKWILSHPNVILFSIVNDYMKVKLDDRNEGTKTELHQKVLLQVNVH